jgi:hypothetical protein
MVITITGDNVILEGSEYDAICAQAARASVAEPQMCETDEDLLCAAAALRARLRRAMSRGTGCYLTPDMVLVLKRSILEEWVWHDEDGSDWV